MKTPEMKAGERIYNVIRGKSVDRLPVIEWTPWWHLTIERWNNEGLGLPYGIYEIQRHFGLDGIAWTGFHPRSRETSVAPHHGAGIIKTEKEYEAVKKTMYKEPSAFYDKEYFGRLQRMRDGGDTLAWVAVEGFFWFAREMLGIEAHLYSFYDEPDLLHLMSRDYCEWLKRVFEFVGNTFKFDLMSFAEDMSYNNGPMLSEQSFSEFLVPYYNKVDPFA